MKVRNGFVSNSSSSSYIIAYDKTGIISDVKDIVNYIENNPRDIIFFKSDLCEGWDLFELDMHQKNYLLKHKKRFINFSKGNVTFTDYSSGKDENGKYPEYSIPFVEALTKVYEFYPYPYEYDDVKVDMSDIPYSELSIEDHKKILNGEDSPELLDKAEKSNTWYRIERERKEIERIRKKEELLSEIRNKFLNVGIDKSDLVVTTIDVDNRSCDSDSFCEAEFASRYFGLDEDTYYEPIGDPDLEDEGEE